MVVFLNMWKQERVGKGICRHRRGKIADITGSFPYNSYHLIALREMAIKIGFLGLRKGAFTNYVNRVGGGG